MKTKVLLTIFISGMISVSCTFVTKITPRADNFAFVFQDIPCGSVPVYVLDSADGTLVYTPLGDTTSTTISLRLTNDELDSIYQKAGLIGFFDYPSKFIIPEDQIIGYQTPASTYELSMMNGEIKNSITWTDDTMTKPGYTEAGKLRELMDLIYGIIQSHPEIQQLPKPKAGCA